MTRSIPSVITITSRGFFISFAQILDSILLTPIYQYITVGTTSSLTYEPLSTVKFTVYTTGKNVDVTNIYINEFTMDNSVNGEAKLQISGDGGIAPFVDITGDVGTGTGLSTTGAGLWINSIDIGTDKLQVRILGRSTDGNPATISISSTTRFIMDIHKG